MATKALRFIILAAAAALSLLPWAAGHSFHSPTHDLAATPADVTVVGVDAGDVLGRGASGDFNGDGIDDLLLAAPLAAAAGNLKPVAGEAYVIFGSPTLSGTRDLASAPANFTVLGADSVDQLGSRVASGDFNGDGIDDLLVGAITADAAANAKDAAGEAYVIFGSPTLGGTLDLATTAPGLTVLGSDTGDELSSGLASGDFNRDGIDDLLLGAFDADAAGNAKSNAGEAYVIFGSPTLAGTIDLATTAPGLAVLGADAGDLLGTSAGSGDFNGDGIADLLLGAPGADAAGNAKSNAGEAYVIFGSPSLGGTIDLAVSAPTLAVLGIDAGDSLGTSVGSGDFNGDRVGDLLLGADGADGPANGKPNAGEAYVIFGSASLGGTLDLAVTAPALAVLGADQLDTLGRSAGSGDFNGDGIDDVILGAPNADAASNLKGEAGEVYVVFGSLTLGGTINLATTAPSLKVLGADISDLLGVSVASGDFNGDRIDDALMNASLADGVGNARTDAGEAYVMFGSCFGSTDSDKDGLCDPFDPDDDNDGFTDVAEAGTPLCANAVNDDNFDDAVIDDGCPGGPAQAGSFSEAQFNIGTGSLDPCGNNGWPADLYSSGLSFNKLTIQDITSFFAPVRILGTNPGDPNFSPRWDLMPGKGIFAKYINVQDITALIAGPTAYPPMLNGARAFGQTCPFPP